MTLRAFRIRGVTVWWCRSACWGGQPAIYVAWIERGWQEHGGLILTPIGVWEAEA